MVRLSQDAIQRMVDGRRSRTTGTGNGGSGGGGVSAGWVDENYLSKAYFNQLFGVRMAVRTVVKDEDDEVISDNTELRYLPPNGILPETSTETDEDTGETTTITYAMEDIQAKAGLWTNSFVSALGRNSGGGGGGGASTLGDLLDVSLGTLSDGQALIWDATSGKWKNKTIAVSGGTVTRVAMTVPTGFGISGSPITNSGTLALTFATGYSLPTTAKQANWDAAYGWGNHANAGYATESWVTGKGYITGINSSMVTSALGFTPMRNNVTFWGQGVSNGVVSGHMSSVGNITMSGSIYMNNGQSVRINDANGNDCNVLTVNGTNTLAIGYNTRQRGYTTDIQGGKITFATNNGQTSDSRLEVGEFNSSGQFYIRQASQGLRIGNGWLIWEESNNAFRVARADNGNAANFYATGAVSALGLSNSNGSTEIGTLTVLDSIKMKDYTNASLNVLSVTKATSQTTANVLNIGWGVSNMYHDTHLQGFNISFIVGNNVNAISINSGGNATFRQRATFNDNLQSSRYYLDSTRYLYLNGSSLMYYNGSTSITIA